MKTIVNIPTKYNGHRFKFFFFLIRFHKLQDFVDLYGKLQDMAKMSIRIINTIKYHSQATYTDKEEHNMEKNLPDAALQDKD